MKKMIALLLCVCIILFLAACGENNSDTNTPTEPKKNEYVISTEVVDNSIVDGVMTNIMTDNPILKKTTASWLDTCVLYEVNIRQYTEEGTFAAFENHLDRLKDMGVNTLWLMPIHPISETNRKGTLGSYYAVSDYKDVNPEFGTMDDFKHLLNKAHDMGFKVIIDWVANHTGWDNKWIKEHDDWYVRNKKGEIESPYDWTDTAKLNYDNYELRAEMIRCMQFWIEDIGVDGFRCDHVVGVPNSFWNAAVYKLKSINSEILMLAESSAAYTLTNYAFDSCYNDAFYGQSMMVQGGIGVSSIKDTLILNDDRYIEGSFPMNYLDNHDKNSYEGTIVSRYQKTYPVLLALTYVSPGMPLIYTSNEEGYDHQIEFFEKDAVKWDSEPKYAPLITALSRIKADNTALASPNRDIEFISAEDSGLFVIKRTDGKNTVYFVANLYKEEIKNVKADVGKDKLTCSLHYDSESLDTEQKEMTASDFESLTLKPYEFYILTSN